MLLFLHLRENETEPLVQKSNLFNITRVYHLFRILITSKATTPIFPLIIISEYEEIKHLR
jgi:hypothetical protein